MFRMSKPLLCFLQNRMNPAPTGHTAYIGNTGSLPVLTNAKYDNKLAANHYF